MSYDRYADADHRIDVAKDEGLTTDEVIFRATPDEIRLRQLMQARHDLANRETAARLMADEMFLRVKDLDNQIDEVKREMKS